MARKLSLMMVAIAVVAFAVPAVASADHLTMPKGTLVPINTEVTATSANLSVLTSVGLIKCEKVVKNNKVTENNAVVGEFEMVGLGEPNGVNCKIGAVAAPIEKVKFFSITGNAVGTAINLTFEATLPGGVKCHFSSVNIAFTFIKGSDVMTITNGKLKSVPAACEPGTLNANFTLSTTVGGGEVILE